MAFIEQYSNDSCYIQLLGLNKGPRSNMQSPFFGLGSGLFSEHFQPECSLLYHPVCFVDSILSVPSVYAFWISLGLTK